MINGWFVYQPNKQQGLKQTYIWFKVIYYSFQKRKITVLNF